MVSLPRMSIIVTVPIQSRFVLILSFLAVYLTLHIIVILVLRTYALYSGNKKVKWFLITILVVCTIYPVSVRF